MSLMEPPPLITHGAPPFKVSVSPRGTASIMEWVSNCNHTTLQSSFQPMSVYLHWKWFHYTWSVGSQHCWHLYRMWSTCWSYCQTCPVGHIVWRWSSQSTVKCGMLAGDFLLGTNILLLGPQHLLHYPGQLLCAHHKGVLEWEKSWDSTLPTRQGCGDRCFWLFFSKTAVVCWYLNSLFSEGYWSVLLSMSVVDGRMDSLGTVPNTAHRPPWKTSHRKSSQSSP